MLTSAILELDSHCRGHIVAAGEKSDGDLSFWNIQEGTRVGGFSSIFEWGGQRLAINEDGSLCVAAAWKKGIVCYEVSTGRTIWKRDDLREIDVVQFSRDDMQLNCIYSKGLARLRVADGSTVSLERGVRKVFESFESNHVLSVGAKGKDYVIRGPSEWTCTPASFAIFDVTFTPQFMCISVPGGPVRCFDSTNGTELWHVMPEPESHVMRLAYLEADDSFYGVVKRHERGHPDALNRYAAASGVASKVGELGHRITSAVFCANGERVVSASFILNISAP